jgi:hypothetical protein
LEPTSCEESRLELQAVGAVVDPLTRGGDPLAGRYGRRVPHYRHEIAMTACLGAQDAEAVLCIVERDALDEAGQHFLG